MGKNLDEKITNNNDNIDKWLNTVANEPINIKIPKQLIDDLSDYTIRDMDKFIDYIFLDNGRNKIYKNPKIILNPDDKDLSLQEYKNRILNLMNL